VMPISYLHYQRISNKYKEQILDHDEHEDIL